MKSLSRSVVLYYCKSQNFYISVVCFPVYRILKKIIVKKEKNEKEKTDETGLCNFSGT